MLKKLLERDVTVLFKEPNTTLDWHGKDQPGLNKLHGKGTDDITLHLTQTRKWKDVEVKYHINSLGLRGPEPNYNAEHRILGMGGSFLFGTGVNEEDTFIHKVTSKLGGSYINVSDADTLTEIVEASEDIICKFQPTCILLADTRFFDEYGLTWRLSYLKARETWSKELKKDIFDLRKTLVKRNRIVLELYLHYLVTVYKVPVFFITANRKDFGFDGNLSGMGATIVNILAVDLARDNRHPGPVTHTNIAEEVLRGFKLD